MPVTELPGFGRVDDGVDDLTQIGVVTGWLDARRTGVLAVGPLLVEVAGIVADDRDRLRGEVGLGHEQLVFEPTLAFGIAEVVLVQELTPEHLVRRDALDEWRVLRGAALDGPAEDVVRDAAKVAGHLAEHNVRVVACPDGVHPLEGLGAELVVLVEELHVLAERLVHADVARLARPAGVLLMDDAEMLVLAGKGVQPAGSGIRGPVVDEQHLELTGRQRLRQQRVDASVDEPARVVDRRYDSDFGRHECAQTSRTGSADSA